MENKSVIITGGQGDIARAIRKLLINKFYIVYSPSRLELDVTNEKQIHNYMQDKKIDILINSAGYIKPNKITDITSEEWDKHFNINIKGAFLCSKYALIYGCKTIINVGSTSAFEGRSNWSAYSSSKAALISFTESLTSEGIEAYSLNPARTKTKMRKKLFPNEDENTLMNPKRVGEFILKILNGEFQNGSHLIIKKDYYYVIPKRKGV